MAEKTRIGVIGAGGIFRSRHFPGLAPIAGGGGCCDLQPE